MTSPWKNANWPLIDMHAHPFFKGKSPKIHVTYNNSNILFCGSCDISGFRHEEYWYEILCRHYNVDISAYSYIGSPLCTLPSLLRRIYVYLKTTEVIPSAILLVAPVSANEHIINGTSYSIMHSNSVMDPLKFVCRAGIVPEKDQAPLISLQQAHTGSWSVDQMVYDFCRDFSFLEMMCMAYNVRLFWTPNLTRNSLIFYENINAFLREQDFARDTFVGYTPLMEVDTMYGSPTSEAHKKIASLFIDADVRDFFR